MPTSPTTNPFDFLEQQLHTYNAKYDHAPPVTTLLEWVKEARAMGEPQPDADFTKSPTGYCAAIMDDDFWSNEATRPAHAVVRSDSWQAVKSLQHAADCLKPPPVSPTSSWRSSWGMSPLEQRVSLLERRCEALEARVLNIVSLLVEPPSSQVNPVDEEDAF